MTGTHLAAALVLGLVGTSTARAESATVVSNSGISTPAPTATRPAIIKDTSGKTALAWLGMEQAKFAENITVSMPIVGVRHWWTDNVGTDLGLGVFSSSRVTQSEYTSTDTLTSGTQTTTPPSNPAWAVHLGIPLRLTAAKHHRLLAIPHVSYQYASAGGDDASVGKKLEEIDNGTLLERSSSALRIGGDLGIDLDFGWLGLEALHLQSTVGLGYRYTSTADVKKDQESRKDENGREVEKMDVKRTTTKVEAGWQTSATEAPWRLLTTNLAFFYYF